jgi:hypothetical protein
MSLRQLSEYIMLEPATTATVHGLSARQYSRPDDAGHHIPISVRQRGA